MVKIEGRELLGHVLDRAKKIGNEFKRALLPVYMKMTIKLKNLPFQKKLMFTGEVKIIMNRAIECCKKFNFNGFARICGDRPFFVQILLENSFYFI